MGKSEPRCTPELRQPIVDSHRFPSDVCNSAHAEWHDRFSGRFIQTCAPGRITRHCFAASWNSSCCREGRRDGTVVF
jgi:hypothetical protein